MIAKQLHARKTKYLVASIAKEICSDTPIAKHGGMPILNNKRKYKIKAPMDGYITKLFF